MSLRHFTVLFILLITTPVLALELDDYILVDLSHSFDEQTLYWPTSPTRFSKETLSNGQTDGGWFYSAFSLCTPEHGGTHLDAPRHFSEQGNTNDAIALSSLISPAVVIDVSQKAKLDSNYRLSVADIVLFEITHGPIPPGSAVLVRTNWSRYWPNARAYLGDDTPGDASKLRFPGYGVEAATLLVTERGVVSLGIDTASIDYGRSTDFLVHRLAAGANVVGLENLTNLADLPPVGTLLFALPTKITGGSGGPARVVALVPRPRPVPTPVQ